MKPKWILIAEHEIGVDEEPGHKQDARILEYHAATTLHAKEDEVPWCSSFINWVFMQLGWFRTMSAAAISWTKWGIKLDGYRYGCVCVKKRKGGNHVFFGVGERLGFVLGLGGNQGNKVGLSWYPKSEIIGYFWPKEAKDLLHDMPKTESPKTEAVNAAQSAPKSGFFKSVLDAIKRLFKS